MFFNVPHDVSLVIQQVSSGTCWITSETSWGTLKITFPVIDLTQNCYYTTTGWLRIYINYTTIC